MHPKSFQEALETKKEKMPKLHWRLSGSTILRVQPARKGHDLAPEMDKKRNRFEIKIKINFQVDFGSKMEPKWSPQGAKMEAKSEENR